MQVQHDDDDAAVVMTVVKRSEAAAVSRRDEAPPPSSLRLLLNGHQSYDSGQVRESREVRRPAGQTHSRTRGSRVFLPERCSLLSVFRWWQEVCS